MSRLSDSTDTSCVRPRTSLRHRRQVLSYRTRERERERKRERERSTFQLTQLTAKAVNRADGSVCSVLEPGYSLLRWNENVRRPSRRILRHSLPHRKSTQVHAVPGHGNQGQTQHKGTATGTAYAALAACRRSQRRPVSSTGMRCPCVLDIFTTTQN